MSKSNEWAKFSRYQQQNSDIVMNARANKNKIEQIKRVLEKSCLHRMSTVIWYILTKQTVACTMAYNIRHLWAKCNQQEQK